MAVSSVGMKVLELVENLAVPTADKLVGLWAVPKVGR
jgi:hypothetical protein